MPCSLFSLSMRHRTGAAFPSPGPANVDSGPEAAKEVHARAHDDDEKMGVPEVCTEGQLRQEERDAGPAESEADGPAPGGDSAKASSTEEANPTVGAMLALPQSPPPLSPPSPPPPPPAEGSSASSETPRAIFNYNIGHIRQ